MTLNDLEGSNSPFCIILLNSVALEADCATVVVDRLIISDAEYHLPLIF